MDRRQLVDDWRFALVCLALLLLLTLLGGTANADTNLAWRPSSASTRWNGSWQPYSATALVICGSTSSANSSTAPIVQGDQCSAYYFGCRADVPAGQSDGCPTPGNYSQEGWVAVAVTPPPPEDPPQDPAPPSFQVRRPPCYLDNVDWYIVSTPDGRRMAMWWCLTPTGLSRHLRAEDIPHSPTPEFADTSNDSIWSVDRQLTTRALTPAEAEQWNEVELAKGPRCYTRTTSSTATSVPVYPVVDGVRLTTPRSMRIGVGERTRCYDGIWTSANSRYCDVSQQLATNGQVIPPDSVALCELRKKPLLGWP